MKTKDFVALFVPFYLATATILIVLTMIPSANRHIFTAVFTIALFGALLFACYLMHSCLVVGWCFDPEHEKPERSRNPVSATKKRTIFLSVTLPLLFSGIVVLVTAFTEKQDFRFYEYVGTYVNYSMPFAVSVVVASLL